MRRTFVAGNWKMNRLRRSAEELAGSLARQIPRPLPAVDVAVCPPFPYLAVVGPLVAQTGIELGAQNAWHNPPGAFTGEVAVEMLLDLGCRWVILGHSERRAILGETDALVNLKVRAATAKDLRVILCVGETLEQRQAGQTERVVDEQMAGSLADVDTAALEKIVIAYEPVWAIGTGVTATADQAQSAHRHLRSWLANRYNSAVADRARILYGGSVKSANAQALLEQPDVDGALVGGASLDAGEFLGIVRASEKVGTK